MAKTVVLTESRYDKLVHDLRKLITQGKAQAVMAANQVLVRTYWDIGKRIIVENLTQNAGYGQAIFQDLSQELDIDVRTLQRCVEFAKKYKTATSSRNLTWSHYKYLLSIEDASKRRWYEHVAAKQKWNVQQLNNAIKEERYVDSLKGAKKETVMIKLKRPTQATYVYKAIVERIIDGDTLLLRIDLGFQVWKEQRVRLAGIDTPSIDQPKGKEAYKYVLNQLTMADFIIVKTNKIDVYGRYVGHVFYSHAKSTESKIFTNGMYLNQDLINKGLARKL